MVISSMWQDSDSEDELPPGWEERSTVDGSVYYINRATAESQWRHPRTGKKKKVTGELPPNWERIIEDGSVVFVDRNTWSKTYCDPRLAFAVEEKEHVMDLRQIFDGSTTASQVLHGMDLSGKVILITGATSGIGLETAKSLCRHGAEVILCGRSESSCLSAEGKIVKEHPTAKIRIMPMDLSSLSNVKQAAASVKLFYKNLDVIILNAGVMGLSWAQTEDGFETIFQVNHLAHFYLTRQIEDLLHGGSRVVVVSSESHRWSNITKENISIEKLSPSSKKGYWNILAYNNSKLCNVLFGFELQRRMINRGVNVFVVHPGNMVSTNIQKHSCCYRLMFALVRPFTKSLQQAAATSVYAAVAPELAGSGGIYLNNCWLCQPSKEARDPELASKLWIISETAISKAELSNEL